MKLRQIRNDPGELAALAGLVAGVLGAETQRFGGTGPNAHVTPETIAARLDRGPGWLVEAGATPVACVFAHAARDWPGALFLEALCVVPEVRRRGLACRLEAAVEAEARRRGYLTLALEVA